MISQLQPPNTVLCLCLGLKLPPPIPTPKQLVQDKLLNIHTNFIVPEIWVSGLHFCRREHGSRLCGGHHKTHAMHNTKAIQSHLTKRATFILCICSLYKYINVYSYRVPHEQTLCINRTIPVGLFMFIFISCTYIFVDSECVWLITSLDFTVHRHPCNIWLDKSWSLEK